MIGIVGAGLSGAVIARELAEAGYEVDVIDARKHVAGMCHTERTSGIMVHKYGPHIFHTDDVNVWRYVNTFANFQPYIHRAKAVVDGIVYSFPINLHTINQFFHTNMSPGVAQSYVERQGAYIEEVKDMEDQAIRLMGYDLYDAFVKGYTLKQWGRHPRTLPASVIKRLPIRFTYEDNYFFHKYQGIPKDGYTAMVENILDHERIRLTLNCHADEKVVEHYDHVFWTAPIDEFFDHKLGRLAYRTLDFIEEEKEGDYQGCAIINDCNRNSLYTRTVEHKHFAPWETHENTIIHREVSRECQVGDDPFYPIRLAEGNKLAEEYEKLAENESNVTFVGRLGTYRYLDMDVTIKEALEVAKQFML